MAIDNLGRDTGGSLPIGALAQGLSKNVSEVMASNDTQSSGKLDSLLQATNKVADIIGDNLSASSRAAGTYAQQIIQTFQSIYRKEAKEKSRGQKEQLTFSKNSVDLISKIYNMGKTPKTFWVGLGHFHPTAISQMQKVLKDCGLCRSGAMDANEVARKAMARRQTAGGGGGGGDVGEEIAEALGGGGSSGGGAAGGVMSSGNGGLLKAAMLLTGAATFLSAAASQLSKAFGVDVMGVFDGVIADSNAFRMQLRDIIYQTKGFGDENREIEASYRDISGIVEATGVMRGRIQTMLLSNIKRGLAMENATSEAGLDQNKIMKKRLVETKRTMSVGIHAAKQLGMNVDGMNNTFMDWRMHLGMGVFEIAQMGRGMHEVARATGLSGAELEKAVQATDQIMKKMKSAGRLSAESAKSVMGMMAAAQKYGVGDQMGKMMEALSSGKGFRDASDQMKVMLIQAAQLSGDAGLATKVKFGQASSPKDMAKVSGGFKTLMTETIGSFGIDDKFAQDKLGIAGGLDLTNLSEVIQEMEKNGFDQQAYALSNHLEKRFEMGIGEIEQMAKALKEGEEAARPYEQKMNDLTQELAKMEKAGMGGTDAFKELQARISETNTNALQTGFEEWAKSVNRSGGDLAAAQKDLSSRLEGTMGAGMADQFAGNLSASADKLLADMNTRATRNQKDLGAMFKDRGFSENKIKKMLVSGTKDQINDAMMVMGEVEEALKVADRTGQDPITQIQDHVVQINNRLGEIVDSAFFGMSDTLMKILFWVGTAGGFLASILGIVTTGLMASSFLSTGTVGSVAGTASSAAGGIMSTVGTAASGITAAGVATVGGTIAGAVMALVGAVKGFSESEEAGRSKLAGTLLGVVTGGAGTGGGFVGKMMGTKEGTTGDKAAGVASATLWGTALGGAIGVALIPILGPFALLVPVIGGLLGGIAQLFKIITAGTTIIEDLLQPFQIIIDYVWGSLKDVWGMLKSIFTLDFSGFIDHAFSLIIRYFLLIPSLIWAGIKRTFITIPQLILTSMKALFVSLPKLLWDTVKGALESLSESEWVGPIFKTLSEAFNEIYKVFMAIYTPIGEAFDAIIGAFQSVGEALFGASEGGSILTFILGIVKGAVHGFATVLGFLLKPLVWIAKVIGFLLQPLVWLAKAIKWVAGLVAKLVNGIIAPFKWLYDVLVGHSIIPDLVFGIVKFFAMLPIKIMAGLGQLGMKIIKFFWELPGKIISAIGSLIIKIVTFFVELPGKIISALGDLAATIGGKIGEVITSIPGMLLGAFEAVFIDFPVWLFGTITSGLANLGTWIWDHTIGAMLNMIPDWIKNMFGGESVRKDEGGGTVTGEAGETLKDVIGGAGRMTVGAGGKLLEGDVMGAAGEVLGGATDVVVGAIDGAIDTGRAVLSAINPLNWFESGTREIAQSGVAMVHEGEMVIPKTVWEQIAAVGSGAFGGGGGITDAFMNVLNPFNAMESIGGMGSSVVDFINPFSDGSIGDSIVDFLNPFKKLETIGGIGNSVVGGVSNVVGDVGGGLANAGGKLMEGDVIGSIGTALDAINPLNMLGSFFGTSQSDEQTKQHHDKKSLYDYLRIAVDLLSRIAMSSQAIAQNLGAFSPEAPADALAKGVSEKVAGSISSNLETALGSKETSDKKSTMAESGKGLYYEMDNITSTVMNAITNPIEAISSLLNWIGGGSASAETSAGNGLDYKEQIKGQVSTVGMSMADMEKRAAQEKASAEGSGSSTAIGMSGVEGILHEEVALMQMMYETLVSIKENTAGKIGTRVIGPRGGNPPPHSTGVKSIARDYVRGQWDFQTNDMSPPAVTNDGRGGN